MPGAHTVTFTDSAFDTEVLRAEKPVLVDFWAEWCPPCRQMGPAIDEIAADYDGRAVVGKLDVTGNAETTARYQIRGIPALLLFRGGKVIAEHMGALSRTELAKLLDAHI